MKSPLHLLHLEDNPEDAALIRRAMERAGIVCEITLAQDRNSFVTALKQGGIDLILTDFTLPSFDGLSALKIAGSEWPSIPLIIVSGTLGEERAVDALQHGATDYIVKDRLGRLVPAVRRAMREVEERAGRQQLEMQFIEAQKMEVIGQLTSGVAHDFNNLLAVIMGCGECIASELVSGSPILKYTNEIRSASKRAAGLTQQLLLFCRKDLVEPTVIDLNMVIAEMDSMLRRITGENIALTFALEKNSGFIMADSGYIGQVLLNLVVNARDAMPNGGKLAITTADVALGEDQVKAYPGTSAGDYVMLSVADTGVGMTVEVKARLFEAFFTTKPKGKGTGLGLATCQAIVRLSGAHIRVRSEIGHGTTFEVYFPRIDRQLFVAPHVERTGPLPRGTETLLVVEDEPSVRNLASDLLTALGYKVLVASNGQDGLRVAQEHKGSPLRLVITDVIMPIMGGVVMAEWLRSTVPNLKILFSSGYSEEAFALDGASEAGVSFLPKPYLPAELASRVRDMLDGSAIPTLT